ncbi:MAG: RDD family protein [Patescibacteria group bacterium]|nr:RDD family protein [Patescibacteria group bacterium]
MEKIRKKLRYAPYSKRFFAFCLDALLIVVIFYCIDLGFSALDNKNALFQLVHFLVIISVSVGFFTFFEASPCASTPGKLLLGLRVVNEEGRKNNFLSLLARNSVKIFTCIYLFMFTLHFDNINNFLYLAIFFSISTNAIWHDFMTVTGGERHKHMLVHDQIAKTEVIIFKKKRRRKLV